MGFQFLLVRLRADPAPNFVVAFFIFQFLLVRLRANRNSRNRVAGPISIPSGAIKRGAGAIAVKVEKKFQFLLVRLRVYGASPLYPACRISIPSGAIKSSITQAMRTK